MAEDAREKTIPLVLLGIALVIVAGGGFLEAPGDAVATMLGFLIGMGLMVLLGILACFIAASMLSVGFGDLGSATLKLTGMLSLASAVVIAVPWPLFFGLFFFWMICYGFFVWLFELDSSDAAITAMIIVILQLLISLFVLPMVG
jgi:hypothetical protein